MQMNVGLKASVQDRQLCIEIVSLLHDLMPEILDGHGHISKSTETIIIIV